MAQQRVIDVLLFGILRERAGSASISVTVDAQLTVGALKAQIEQAYPDLAQGLAACRVAIDRQYAGADAVVAAASEVALIPPVSGGCDDAVVVRLQQTEIDVSDIYRFIARDDCGGQVVFTGTVRNHHNGRRVLRLEYEAYVPMAEQQLLQLARQVQQRDGVGQVAVVHRYGPLRVGETAIAVAVAAPHRAEAFAAAADLMDRIKAEVPIWKQEFYADGRAEWVRCTHGVISDD